MDFKAIPEGKACTFSYYWDFGDGGTSNAQNPSHKYNETGTYQVKLTGICQEYDVQVSDTLEVVIEEGRTLDEIESDFWAMVAGARFLRLDLAANNLEHFLGNTGSKKIIPSSTLLEFSSTHDAVEINLGRFETQIFGMIDSMPNGKSDTLSDHWDSRQTAFILTEPDLYYGSGTFTVTSKSNITVNKSFGVELNYTWVNITLPTGFTFKLGTNGQ